MSEELWLKVEMDVVLNDDGSRGRAHHSPQRGGLVLLAGRSLSLLISSIALRIWQRSTLVASVPGRGLEPAPRTLSPRDRVCTSSSSASVIRRLHHHHHPTSRSGPRPPGCKPGARTNANDPRGASRGAVMQFIELEPHISTHFSHHKSAQHENEGGERGMACAMVPHPGHR